MKVMGIIEEYWARKYHDHIPGSEMKFGRIEA